MRKSFLFCFFIVLLSIIFVLRAEVLESFKVDVPLRVYDKDKFVTGLTRNDLVVYENSQEVKVESLCLIKKAEIKRSEGVMEIPPFTSRNFILIFQATEYTSKIADNIEFVFNQILLPGDRLILVTPEKPYNFSQQTLEKYTKDQLIDAIKKTLKRDISMLGASSESIVKAMRRIIKLLPNELGDKENIKQYLIQYKQLLGDFNTICKINESDLLELSDALKQVKGQSHIFLFYQQEFRPIPDYKTINDLSRIQDYKLDDLADLDVFELNKRIESINVKRMQEVFADVAVTFHFIYIKNPQGRLPRLIWKEHSVDMFNTFSELASETGGIVETTSKPDVAFRHAAGTAENYYLITYVSPDPERDGGFRNIEIKLKDKAYKVIHRKGYFAK